MQNCVFAAESDILDKLEYLFKNPDKLQNITQAGYDLVHSRHTSQHRDQLLQWYKLNKDLEPWQRIVQCNPFGKMAIAERPSISRNRSPRSNGLHLALLQEGDEALWMGRFEQARKSYQRCLNYMCRLPEAKFRLALCSLYQGDPENARVWIWEPIQYTLAEYNAVDPDPTEWAYYIISLLAEGKLRTARRRSAEFPWLRHAELDRVRWVVNFLANAGDGAPFTSCCPGPHRASIHYLPERDIYEWIHELCKILGACGQDRFLNLLTARVTFGSQAGQRNRGAPHDYNISLSRSRTQPHSRSYITAKTSVYRFVGHKLSRMLKNGTLRAFRYAKRKVAPLLPHLIVKVNHDALSQAVDRLAREEDVNTIVIIGPGLGRRGAEFLRSTFATKSKLMVFCIDLTRDPVATRTKFTFGHPTAKRYRLSSSMPQRVSEELAETVSKLTSHDRPDRCYALLVEGSEITRQGTISHVIASAIGAAQFVVLSGIEANGSFATYQSMLRNREYDLLDYNFQSSGGFAIFKKQKASDAQKDCGSIFSSSIGEK
jgi:hypothetical protein